MYTPIADDNKGARMLANMGWKKGEGLGKDGSGILDPVKAESYAQSAGIGSTTKRDVGSGGGSYQSRTLDTVSLNDCIGWNMARDVTKCGSFIKIYKYIYKARKRLYGDR